MHMLERRRRSRQWNDSRFLTKNRGRDRIRSPRVFAKSRCAMHHGEPVFFLLILLLPFGPLPIPPADHVASPEHSTNYNLLFDIARSIRNVFCPPSQAFVLYHEIFPDNPESSVLTIAPCMKRNYGGKKIGPCEKQKLIVTHGRSMVVCNPIWSTEQTHRSRIRARSGFLQGARLKTTCRCCSSLDDNLPWVGESNLCASARPTRVYCTPWEAIEPVLSMKCQKPNAYLRLWQNE